MANLKDGRWARRRSDPQWGIWSWEISQDRFNAVEGAERVGKPRLTAVIPTIGRSSLRAAVESALAQSDVQVDVIVAVAREDALDTVSELLDDLTSIRLVLADHSAGGGAARRLGTAAASGDWIAYLDDDDTWMHEKAKRQIDFASEHSIDVASCSFVSVCDGVVLGVGPRRGPRDGEAIGDYLFVNRNLSYGRNSLHTSTLIARSAVAKSIQWDAALTRHQDWDFVLRAEANGFSIGLLLEPLVTVAVASTQSISRSNDWSVSLDWVGQKRHILSQRARVDFLAGQVLRYAIQARDVRGAGAVMVQIWHARTLPSFRTVALAFKGLVPEGLLRRAVAAYRRLFK